MQNKLEMLASGNIYDCAGYTVDLKSLVINTDDVVIKNLSIKGTIEIKANNVTLDGCHADSITVDGCENVLVARCVAKSIGVYHSFNCPVILNKCESISCKDNTNVYTADNNVSCSLALDGNNYVIAEGNVYGELCASNNNNVNGNTLTDVNARADVGANEDILPHTNKELFVGMQRKNTVANTEFTVRDYIFDRAKAEDDIIIPPGAYSVPTIINIGGDEVACKNIYAYGVYCELAITDYSKYPHALFEIKDTHDVNVYGLTIGYTLPSSGQVRVVDKSMDGERCLITVIADAGFMDGFTTTDPDLYMTWWPEMFLVDENGEYSYRCDENTKGGHKATRNYDENGNYDGTMTIEFFNRGPNHYTEAKPAKDVWDRTTLGTVITCRLASPNKVSYSVISSQNILLRDCVLYGYSAALSAYAHKHCENVEFLRYHDAAHSATLIDKETFDKYRAYEEKYGVSFELYVDEKGRYRGAPSRSCSVDAFHISMCKQGVNITSSLLESMVDDGSNQHAASARLHRIDDNGDGTATVIYKPLVPSVQWNFNKNVPGEDKIGSSCCMEFKKGDLLYMYNPYGRAICETRVLEDGITTDEIIDIDLRYDGIRKHITRPSFALKVNLADIDFEALVDYKTGKEFDLSDNGIEMTNRVTVDNLSYNCSNYTIDNTMVRNGHSRGFLIKAVGVDIKNCTFRNVSYNGLLLRPETGWAESTTARHILIDKCLFDNTGFIFQAVAEKEQACIRIQSTSTVVSEGTLPIDDIQITGCKFTNNEQKYAIWINSAKNIVIKDNVFDSIVANVLPEIPGTAVLLDTCMNIEISGNTYNYEHFNGDIKNVIKGANYANIIGTDVTDKDGNAIFPDNVIKA
ncbi:MAG: hypothetical protein E7649_00725 [Ruminococcaceae bacterium]|nr:hypothetical protein [Oscillospiraceae bacterium]